MTFEGFNADTTAWFNGLMLDNSRAYFTANRKRYEQAVRQPLLDLLTDLSLEFGGTVKLFRQNRDTRFSADKSPYKTNAYGLLLDRPDTSAALYVAVSADGLQTATGYYEMAKDQLARFRHVLTASEDAVKLGAELRGLLDGLRGAGFEVDGTALTGMPRGISKEAPNADLARYKSLTVGAYQETEQMYGADAAQWIAGVWRAAAPLNAWLDRHVGESVLAPEERWRA